MFESQSVEGSNRRHYAARLWVVVVASSVFGPYIIGNVRSEQIVVLLSVTAVLIVGWPHILAARSFAPMPVAVLWLVLLTVISLATIWPPSDLYGYSQSPIPNAYGAFILPVALMVVSWFWTLIISTRDIVTSIARTIIAGMVSNALLSLWQLMSNNVVVVGILPRFWAGGSGSPSATTPVAVLAAENGRFTGIFNQPAEAGIAYGIALFGLIYLVHVSKGYWTKLPVLCATCVCVGGVLTISKIFLIGALPIALVLIVRDRRGRGRTLCWLAILSCGYEMLKIGGVLPAWQNGPKMLNGLLDPTGSLITTFTAQRYGSEGTLDSLASNLLHISPWIGFGAGGVDVPYDSMWIEALAVAGIFGVALMGAAVIFLFVK